MEVLAGNRPLGGREGMKEDFFHRVYHLARQIPQGKVATYGQIAAAMAAPQAARLVGYALAALKEGSVRPPVPWQRVINSRGKISLTPGSGFEIQRDLLAMEGVFPDESGVYDLAKYLMTIENPPGKASREPLNLGHRIPLEPRIIIYSS